MFTILFIVFVSIVVMGLVAGFIFSLATGKKDEEVFDDEDVNYKDFEEKFIEQVNEGKKYQHFLNVASQTDCAMIRSLLDAEGICTYTENENVNGAYGGIGNAMTNLFCIKLYILNEDYDKALEIVADFIRKKAARLSEGSEKNNFEASLTILAGIIASPYAIDKDHEMLGISIKSKESE